MSLTCNGVTYKIIRNNKVVGSGTTESNAMTDHRKAVMEAFKQYVESEQFEKDTYNLSNRFSIEIDYLVDTDMPS